MRKRTADFLQGVYLVLKQIRVIEANPQQCSTEPDPRTRSVSARPPVVVRSECRVRYLLFFVRIVCKKFFVSISQFDVFYNAFLCIVPSRCYLHTENMGEQRVVNLGHFLVYLVDVMAFHLFSRAIPITIAAAY